MNMELPQPLPAEQEPRGSLFPIVNDERRYWSDETPTPQEGVIIRFYTGYMADRGTKGFLLQKTIAGLHYHITLTAGYGDSFSLGFTTKEYELATTNLSATDREELFACIKNFIESIEATSNIREITFYASAASYSSEEIERCYEEILASPLNTDSREQLIKKYTGFEVFDRYANLFDKNFHEKHYNLTSRRAERVRLFTAMARRGLPNWSVTSDPSGNIVLTKNT